MQNRFICLINIQRPGHKELLYGFFGLDSGNQRHVLLWRCLWSAGDASIRILEMIPNLTRFLLKLDKKKKLRQDWQRNKCKVNLGFELGLILRFERALENHETNSVA